MSYAYLRFANKIENSFNMMLLLQMLSCTIQICSQSYQVIMVRRKAYLFQMYIVLKYQQIF